MSSTQRYQFEAIISQIEQELQSAPELKTKPGNWCRIDREYMLDRLVDLKSVIPQDIRQAQGVLATKDQIIRDVEDYANGIADRAQREADDTVEGAREEAFRIVDDAESRAADIQRQAENQARNLVEETVIMQSAKRRADSLIADAEATANEIVLDAQQYATDTTNKTNEYADAILSDLQYYMQGYLKQIDQNRDTLYAAMEREAPSIHGEPQKEARSDREQISGERKNQQAAAPAPKVRKQSDYEYAENDYVDDARGQALARPRSATEQTPARTQGSGTQVSRVPAPRRSGDDFDDDGGYVAPNAPVHRQANVPPRNENPPEAGKKKQNWFQRMWNGDDVEDLDDDWDDNPAPAPKKRSGFKLFETMDEED